jgi:hypothetical protein
LSSKPSTPKKRKKEKEKEQPEDYATEISIELVLECE